MNTYLLTWNPENWMWEHLAEQAKATVRGRTVVERWSCGNTKRIVSGDRLFLLIQGRELPKGIMASGVATSGPYSDRHWDDDRAGAGETALYIEAAWDAILNVPMEMSLPVSAFNGGDLPPVHWATMRSGILIPPETANYMEALWARHVAGIRGELPTGAEAPDDSDAEAFPEGRILYRLHRLRERNRELVLRAKSAEMRRSGRLACAVCDFDFHKRYGPVGEGFIECHHTIPVSELDDGGATELKDVALVCANCHRMLHRKRPWLRVEALRHLLDGPDKDRNRPDGS